MTFSDEVRQAADVIQKLGHLNNYTRPETAEWSPRQLRAEADYLEKPWRVAAPVDGSANQPIPQPTETSQLTNGKTFAEQLDAAQSSEDFLGVLNRIFVAAFNESGKS